MLEVDGQPTVDLPLTERRALLERLLEPGNQTVRASEAFTDGEALLEAASDQGLGRRGEEGRLPVLGREAHSEWLKIKLGGRQEFVIAGYTRGQGRRSGAFGSLVLAVQRGGELGYVGNVGTGFSDAEIDRLLGKLRPLERKSPPFPEGPKMPRVRKDDVVWVTPKLVAEVKFTEWTHDGHLRARFTSGCVRTNLRRTCAGSCPSRTRSRRASGCCACRTSTRRSGPTRGSRRASCSRTTRRSRRSSSRT